MSSPIDRRTFLKQAAAASLILGFPFLARAAEPTPDLVKGGPPPMPKAPPVQVMAEVVDLTPNAGAPALSADHVMGEALVRMKKEHKPAVVILAPAEPAAATAMAGGIERMMNADSSAVHQAFCEAVFVCLPAGEAKRFAGHKAQWGVVLVDADSKAVDGIALDAKDGLTAEQFGAKVLDMIHGPAGERRSAAARAQREAMDAAARERLDTAIADLSHRDYRKREAAADRLVEMAPAAASVLAEAVTHASDSETRRGLQATFTRVFQSAKMEERAPFGTQWVQEAVDPCPGCGLSRMPAQSRQFLRLTCGQQQQPGTQGIQKIQTETVIERIR